MEKLLYVGIGLVVVSFGIGLLFGKPYNESNLQKVASFQRMLCVASVVGYFLIAYWGLILASDAWWTWILTGVSGIIGCGTLIEVIKPTPYLYSALSKDQGAE